jgi:nitroreductase
MDIVDVIKQRYSVRAYQPISVEETKLSAVLNAARLAPTAANQQPFQIIVIHTAGREEELLSIYPKKWFVQAPIILCICGTPTTAWVQRDGRSYLFVDIGIVMDHIVLTAASLGLGTCIVAAFDEMNAHTVLALPQEVEPILFTPLGYPADALRPKVRKELSDLVRYEKW